MSARTYSIIEYHSRQEENRCGYCRRPDGNYNHGMTAHQLKVQHYQYLIDRGWRRSGCYCYKPMMKITCCPHYTIKCDALDFKVSKSQKKILKRIVKFLKNELPKNEEKASRKESNEDIVRSMEISEFSKYSEMAEQDSSKMQITSVSEELSNRLSSNANKNISSKSTKKKLNENITSPPSQPKETKAKETRAGFDPPQKKAKLLRIERKQKKLLAQGKTQEEVDAIMHKKKLEKLQNTGKSLEDMFDEINNCSNKLELRLVRTSPKSDSYKSSASESFELYKKYQATIHGDDLSRLTEKRYKRFLVTSPLREWTPEDGPPQGYGSFHEQYWLNGTLIAVAVIDILPLCVSSVYFFYDPDYSYLSLGTFSSLREVLLTRQLNKSTSNLKYYYMGYYIHSCTKMRYKAKMRPSKLLCPETYVWFDIDKCLPKLDVSKYCKFNEDASVRDEDGEVDILQVLILYHRKVMTYGLYRRFLQDESLDHRIKEYATLVGRECALNMLYFVQ